MCTKCRQCWGMHQGPGPTHWDKVYPRGKQSYIHLDLQSHPKQHNGGLQCAQKKKIKPTTTTIKWVAWPNSTPSPPYTSLMRGQHKTTRLHLLRERAAWYQALVKSQSLQLPPARTRSRSSLPIIITILNHSLPGYLENHLLLLPHILPTLEQQTVFAQSQLSKGIVSSLPILGFHPDSCTQPHSVPPCHTHNFRTLCDPMNCSTPDFPVHHQLPETAQTRVHPVSEAIQSSYPLSSPSPPAFNLSQHQGLFQ